VAGGKLPLVLVTKKRWREFFKFFLSPWGGAAFVLSAELGDVFWGGEASFVTEGVTDVGGGVGDPFVAISAHGDHEAFVFFAIEVTAESMKEGANGAVIFADDARVICE